MNIETNELELKDVWLSYPDGTSALRGVSLSVSEAEIVALIGASGSGKSSVLRAIAGLEDIRSGQIFWGQQRLDLIPTHKRGVGFMFQEPELFAHKNVLENIAYGLRVQKMPRQQREREVARLLQLVGLSGLEKRPAENLSGGQKQRVSLARALAPKPKILLLDEPLSALDRDLRERLALDLRKILKEAKITAILVTHDETEANLIADRVVKIEDGKITK